MKILFWGNQDNNSYKLCKLLRRKGLNCELYVFTNDNPRSFPEQVDETLDGVYPGWIKVFNNTLDWKLLFPPKRIITEVNATYDIIIASGVRGILSAYHFSIPIICFPLGSDLKKYPFPIKNRLFSPKVLVSAYLLRKTFRRAVRISAGGDYNTQRAIGKLGLMPKCFINSVPDDVGAHVKNADSKLIKSLRERYASYDYVFIWLSRIICRSKNNVEYKGTDFFVEALKRLVDTGFSSRIKVLLADHGEGAQGMREEVMNHKLREYVDFVPHLPYNKLLAYLSIQNGVVFDCMSSNCLYLGGLAREALCLGNVLVRNHDPLLTEVFYGSNCPVVKVSSVDDVYSAIRDILCWSKQEYRLKREETLKWAQENLNWERLLAPWIRAIQEVHNLSRIQKKAFG